MTENLNRLRLDKWLWAARFYKTRSLAAEAIKGGKISLNGQRAKPGKEIQPGAVLKIRQGIFVREMIICGLSSHRGPAPEAQCLYEETEQSRVNGLALKQLVKNQAAILPQSKGRPNKRDRQKIIRFTRKTDI